MTPGYRHILVAQGLPQEVLEALRKCAMSSGFRPTDLSPRQLDWLTRQARDGGASFQHVERHDDGAPGQPPKDARACDWRVYSVAASTSPYTFIVPYHKRGDWDVSFSDEAAEMSCVLPGSVMYFWWEHATCGKELFRSGQRIKSIIEDTHGPGITIDGRKVPLRQTQVDNRTIRYSFDQMDQELSAFPKDVLDQAEELLQPRMDLWNADAPGLVLMHERITDVDSYIRKMNLQAAATRIGCCFLPLAIVLALAAWVIYRIVG